MGVNRIACAYTIPEVYQMNCPACASEIPDNSQLCPRCGQTIPSARAAVQLDFGGTAMQLLGWLLLAIVSALVVIPLAWVYAATGRWVCRNVKFSDGTTAAFRGTGGQILGWIILYLAVIIGFQFANTAIARQPSLAGLALLPLLFVVYIAALVAILLKIIGWVVSNVELSSGPPLSFTGTFMELVGWNLLIVLSAVTIIGWAWATGALYRWYARNTRGQGIEFQLLGKGHQILWRTLVTVLASMLIIPIPWMYLWLMRWFVQNFSMTRSTDTAAVAAA